MPSDCTVYLAGPVDVMEDGGAEWRNAVTETFGDEYYFKNPLAKYNLAVEDIAIVDGESNPNNDATVGVDEIVHHDKDLIRESDGVLVGYSRVHSIGTPMEVMFARERNMPVAIWVRDGTEFDDLSPWYRHHATAITNSTELALNHIKEQAALREVPHGE